MMAVDLSLTFLRQGQICVLIYLYGENCWKIYFLKMSLMAETYNMWLKQENICYIQSHSMGGGVRGGGK